MPFRGSWPALINFITASLTASYYIQNVPGRSSSKYDVVQSITDNFALQIISRVIISDYRGEHRQMRIWRRWMRRGRSVNLYRN